MVGGCAFSDPKRGEKKPCPGDFEEFAFPAGQVERLPGENPKFMSENEVLRF
jgi:hypothetical protein